MIFITLLTQNTLTYGQVFPRLYAACGVQ